MVAVAVSKTERIDIRASTAVKLLFQEAAQSCHKNVSEFLLEAGITAANHALAERRFFQLNDGQWEQFQAALDRPVVSAKPKLKALLTSASVLDQA
ncbi:MAG: hypothetical protein RIR18_540 [Pseudomonadota bacterium]|jgi:uncharacterized protein (DUF1778 family)